MAEIKRDPAPPAEHRYPECGVCGEETTGDGDGYDCDDCGVSYSNDGSFSQWHDDEAEQCEARAVYFHPQAHRPPRRCLLNDGHAGHHIAAGYVTWDREPVPLDDDEANPGGWRALTVEQADRLQAEYDERMQRRASRG